MKKIISLFLVLIAAFFTSCSRSEKNIGSPENPIVFALSKPYYEKLSKEKAEIFEKKLNEKTGLFVKLSEISQSAEMIEAIGAGKIDSAMVSVNEYLIARQDYRSYPILQALRGKGEKKYFSGIVVLDKNIKSIDDLQGKKIAARDPYSIGSFVLPTLFFSVNKNKPTFVFTGSYENSLKKLISNEVAAASLYEKMIKANKDLKLIQIMGPIPNEPVICRKDLDANLCLKIKEALLSIVNEKDGKELISSMADITGFDEVNSEAYKDLHETILNSGKDIYSLVPDSVNLKKIQEPYYFD